MKGERDCLAFGGFRVDDAVGREVLRLVEPFAIEVSLQVIETHNAAYDEQRKLLELELQSAEYEAQRAYRQYDQVDPENRVVCAQLEAKWNTALQRCEQIRKRLRQEPTKIAPLSEEQKQSLVDLTQDLPALWNADTTTSAMRKQVFRSVIEEVICDVDEEKSLVLLELHWVGVYTASLRLRKTVPGNIAIAQMRQRLI
jgi:hypothetical protein